MTSKQQVRRERLLRQLARMRLMDDTLMSVVFENEACTQYLLRTVLENDTIEVLSVVSQRSLPNLRGRGVRFDILAQDKTGKLYNIEVQRTDVGAVPKRARYNSAMLDANHTTPGDDYGTLPESYVIFITESDVLKKGLPLYHIDRMVRETGEAFGDDAHILYVNGEYCGDDPIGALMHDFRCTEPNEMYSPILAKETGFLKHEQKGVNSMCRIMEEFVKEEREEAREEGQIATLRKNIAALIEKGLTLEEAMDMLNLDAEDRALLRSK